MLMISSASRAKAFLGGYKDQIASVQSLITIIAIFVGGFWSYRVFIQERQSHPRLEIEHKIQHWKISSDQILLSVNEILTNTGPVKVDLRGGTIRVIQVMPLPQPVANDLRDVQSKTRHSKAQPSILEPKVWDVLVDSPRKWKRDKVVIEPGENDVVPNEFIIPANIQVVAVYSYITNPDDPKLGWNGLTYYDLTKAEREDVASDEDKGLPNSRRTGRRRAQEVKHA